MYPTLDIQAGAGTGNFAGGRKSDSTDSNFFIAPTLNWEIDFWGKFRRANEAARAELVASEYSMRTVQISLISEVVSTYYLLLDLHMRLEISRRTLESRIGTLDIIQQRFDKGIVAGTRRKPGRDSKGDCSGRHPPLRASDRQDGTHLEHSARGTPAGDRDRGRTSTTRTGLRTYRPGCLPPCSNAGPMFSWHSML